jgi:hypothetical protein
MVSQFLEHDEFSLQKDWSVLEPCCGQGSVVTELERFGVSDITSYDINQGINFFDENRQFDCIITNPSYSIFQEFVEHCFSVAQKRICLLLPLNYLQSKKRYDRLFARNLNKNFTLWNIYVFVRMPMLSEDIQSDGRYETGMQAYAWFVWAKLKKSTFPKIHWIDNSEYVIRNRV